MESPDRPSRTRTIILTLTVIGLLAALTWYRARLGRAQWGAPDPAESALDTAVRSNASGD